MSNNFGKRTFDSSDPQGSTRGPCNINANKWCQRLCASNCRCSDPIQVRGKGSTYNSHFQKAHMSYVGPGW